MEPDVVGFGVAPLSAVRRLRQHGGDPGGSVTQAGRHGVLEIVGLTELFDIRRVI
jgi:hypothetical protein